MRRGALSVLSVVSMLLVFEVGFPLWVTMHRICGSRSSTSTQTSRGTRWLRKVSGGFLRR